MIIAFSNFYIFRKHLFFELYEHLIYSFYLTRQFASWDLAKLQKQSLGFVVLLGFIQCKQLKAENALF